MKAQRVLLIAGSCLLIGVAFFISTNRLVLVGWFKGESFFRQRPTSYWVADLENWELVTARLSGDYYLFPPTPPAWYERMTAFFGRKSARSAALHSLHEGDPAAYHVLMELLQKPDRKMKIAAAMGLARLGPSAKVAWPTLAEVAKTTPSYFVYLAAVDAMLAIDRDGYLQQEKEVKRPDLGSVWE